MAGGYISRKLRDKIKERTGFDTEDLRPVNNVGQITCPVLYVHSRKDKLVHIKHSKALFEVSFLSLTRFEYQSCVVNQEREAFL